MSPFLLWAVRRLAAALCVLSAVSAVSSAQTTLAVRGSVADSVASALPGATVALLTDDGVVLAFATAGMDGRFVLAPREGAVVPGPYVVQASFVGYETRRVPVPDSSAGDVDVGTIVLASATAELGRLVVERRAPPVLVRSDTLDYRAASFGAPPGGKAEDLLRRLPGVEVSDDGTIRAHGEVVEHVLIDGEEMFAGAPTLTTRNLPADAIDRVQIYGRSERVGALAGGPDGGRTINLQLRDDRRGVPFGTGEAGLGIAEGGGSVPRFDGRTAVYRVGRSLRMAAIASANNVNRAALSFNEYVALSGGVTSLVPGADGVVRLDGGLPLADAEGRLSAGVAGGHLGWTPAPALRVRASYFGVESRTDLEAVRIRTRPTADARADVQQETAEATGRLSLHRVAGRADFEPSESHSVQVIVGAVRDVGVTGEDALVTSAGALPPTRTRLEGSERSARANADVAYRGALAGGRRLVAGASASYARAEEGATRELGVGRPEAEFGRTDVGGQLWEAGGRVSLAQPLGSAAVLSATAEGSLDDASRTSNGSALAGGLAQAAARTSTGTLGLQVLTRWDGYDVRVGLAATSAARVGTSAGGALDGGWTRVLPSLRLERTTVRGLVVELGYRADVRPPTLADLDPTLVVRGPFETVRGSPDLTPETAHVLSASVRRFDAFTLASVFVDARVSYVPRALSSSRTIGDGSQRVTTRANVGDAWSAGVVLTGSHPVRRLRGSIGLSGDVATRIGAERVDGQESAYASTAGSADLQYRNDAGGPVDLSVGLRATLQSARYEAGGGHTLGTLTPYAEAAWAPSLVWFVRSDVRYPRPMGGSLDGARAPTWDVEMVRTLQGGRIRVHLVGADLLDGGVDIVYTSSAGATQEDRLRSLGRRVLVKVAFALPAASPG